MWHFFLFLHVLVVAKSRKNDMGAIGVVETGYGHGHKVGWIWFGIRRSLAARKMGGGGRKSSLLVYFSMSVLWRLKVWICLSFILKAVGESLLILGLHCKSIHIHLFLSFYLYLFLYILVYVFVNIWVYVLLIFIICPVAM